MLIPEAHDVDRVASGRQLAGEIFDVNTGASVDVRRVLVGQDGDAHLRTSSCAKNRALLVVDHDGRLFHES
jgi:hypothetical protein